MFLCLLKHINFFFLFLSETHEHKLYQLCWGAYWSVLTTVWSQNYFIAFGRVVSNWSSFIYFFFFFYHFWLCWKLFVWTLKVALYSFNFVVTFITVPCYEGEFTIIGTWTIYSYNTHCYCWWLVCGFYDNDVAWWLFKKLLMNDLCTPIFIHIFIIFLTATIAVLGYVNFVT